MTKLIGAAFIILPSVLLGAYAWGFFTYRAQNLEALLDLVTHIETEINGYLSPLDTIYARFKCNLLERSGFTSCLAEKGGIAAIDEYAAKLCLTDEEKMLLLQFFESLGSHGAVAEAKHCAYYKTKLSELSSVAKSEARTKKRLCLSLFTLLGIMLSVILI